MCPNLAVSTLTYVYAEGTIVLGPLATLPEPHCYDLCSMHSAKMVAPKGWELVRIGMTTAAAVGQNSVPTTAQPRTAHLRVVPKP
ncbi:MAG: hypothetical protein RL038_163 [Actinomycetota bacterium]|jgi:hypothetical protein